MSLKGGNVNNYIIHFETQAIMETRKGNFRTEIIEKDGVTFSLKSPLAILSSSTRENGLTLEGSFEIAKKILKTNSKLPASISPFAGIYFFPTTSPRNKDCIWFSFYQIKDYKEVNEKKVAVILQGGRVMIVDTSFNQFDLQYKKTCQIIAYYHRLLYVNRSLYLF